MIISLMYPQNPFLKHNSMGRQIQLVDAPIQQVSRTSRIGVCPNLITWQAGNLPGELGTVANYSGASETVSFPVMIFSIILITFPAARMLKICLLLPWLTENCVM
jgi:hypothetical protein